MATQKLKIEGMTCGACANSATRALKEVSGVTDARVSLAAGEAEIQSSVQVDPALLKSAVEKKGFRATVVAVQSE